MGALIYGPSRIGKTRAIEYVRLLLARNYPKMTSYHAQCEHKPRHAEGPFFANLLEAVGDPDPNAGSNPSKRLRLSLRIREAAARAGSGTGAVCDEAQRYNENEYEWLRDVHDALDRQQIKLFTFLVGQQDARAENQSADCWQDTDRCAPDGRGTRVLRHPQCGGRRDVLERIRSTAYPESSEWSFTRFYIPQAFDAGYRLVSDADISGMHSRPRTTGPTCRADLKFRWNRSREWSRSS